MYVQLVSHPPPVSRSRSSVNEVRPPGMCQGGTGCRHVAIPFAMLLACLAVTVPATFQYMSAVDHVVLQATACAALTRLACRAQPAGWTHGCTVSVDSPSMQGIQAFYKATAASYSGMPAAAVARMLITRATHLLSAQPAQQR